MLIKFNLTEAGEMLVSNLRTARRMIKQPDIWAPNGCYEGIVVWYRGSEDG